MPNLSTTDHRETLSAGELAWTCVDEVQHYYSCDQDLIVFNNYRAESYFTFIAYCCNRSRSPYVQTPSRTFNQVATKNHLLLFCFPFILKLGDKGAAVPNVDHDSLHARVLGKLPVK